MNKIRILGIIILLIGIYLINLFDKYDFGFFGGALTGVIATLGLGLIAFGKFKFWDKS